VEHLVSVSSNSSGLPTASDQQGTLNCVRLLTRLLPFIFEDPSWRNFFWSALPDKAEPTAHDTNDASPLAHSLLASIAVSNRHFLHG
jgi:hypothetical protein